jgi:hypothetical protein
LPEKDPSKLSELDKFIINTVTNTKPKNINQLIQHLRAYPESKNLSKEKILDRILDLQDQGKIILQDELQISHKFNDYIFSIRAYWYLLIIAIVASTTIIIIANLEKLPIIGDVITYIRYILGSAFVLFLPGYSFIKALFPIKEIDNIERVALSIGMSLAIVAANALLLNYTPWGISITPITISLSLITIAFATIAVLREYQKLFQKTI